MKKLFISLIGLIPALSWAAGNNIKMVTYFPVPYASYDNLHVDSISSGGKNWSGNCDVGIFNTCSLNVGGALSGGNMTAEGPGVRFNMTGNNPSISAKNIEIKNSTSSNDSILQFAGNTTIDSISSSGNNITLSTKHLMLESDTLNIGTIQGGEVAFPFSDCGNDISWKELTIDGQQGLYLVCGTGSLSCKKTAPYCEEEKNGTCVKKTCSGNQILNPSNCTCQTPEVTCLVPFEKEWITTSRPSLGEFCGQIGICSGGWRAGYDSYYNQNAASCVSQYMMPVPSSCSGNGACDCNTKYTYYNSSNLWSVSTCGGELGGDLMDRYTYHKYKTTFYQCVKKQGSCSSGGIIADDGNLILR